MKKSFKPLLSVLLLIGVFSLSAGQPGVSHKGSPEFERMKTLVGKWKGTVDMGQGLVEMVSQYRLLAGGSVLEERVFAGTPHEMVTMYYDEKGKLTMTHYCVMGNRPGMVLKSSDENTLKFDFDKNCGINPEKESHMHSLTITFDSPNSITSACGAIIDGQEMPAKPTTMTRIK